ncbi:MAG: ribulose-phosphate 3-epimerase [Gemmatimonadetes bacterium]|nr:ribulose-phosphate 3-epimerase [Gemmatimonadota bacterium]
MTGVKIAPSILSADFARLGEEIRVAEAAGAEWIHLDVMDGQFVPNISFGPMVVAAARRVTQLTLDVHLMIDGPERYLDRFVEAGADRLTVHQEVSPHLQRTVDQIHALGARAGVAINPATPAESLTDILPFVDLVLVMSVNPGFGGQSFIARSTAKVARIREMLASGGFDAVEVQVDGGIDATTAPQVVRAGATVLVAGSAIFGATGSVADNLASLRAAANAARLDGGMGSG